MIKILFMQTYFYSNNKSFPIRIIKILIIKYLTFLKTKKVFQNIGLQKSIKRFYCTRHF